MTLLEIKAAVIAVLLCALTLGWAWQKHVWMAEGARQCQAAHTAEALAATTEARAEEQRRTEAAKEANDEAQRLANRARADASAVDAAAPGLRSAFAVACFRPGPGDTASAPRSASAAPEPNLRSDVFGEIEDRLRALAEEATQRGNRGASCERRYDSLLKPQ